VVLSLPIIKKGTQGLISQAAFAFSVYYEGSGCRDEPCVLFCGVYFLHLSVLTGEWGDG